MYHGYFIGEYLNEYYDSKIDIPLSIDPYAGGIKWKERPALNSNLWAFIGYWTDFIKGYSDLDKDLEFFDTSGNFNKLTLEIIDENWKSTFQTLGFRDAWNTAIYGMNYWLGVNPSDFQKLTQNEVHDLNIAAENARKVYSAITSTIIYISRKVGDGLNDSLSKAKSVLSFISKELLKSHTEDDAKLLSDLAKGWSEVFNNINVGYGYYIAAFDKLIELINSFNIKYAQFSGIAKIAIEGLVFKLDDDNRRLKEAKPNIVKYVDSIKSTIKELSEPFEGIVRSAVLPVGTMTLIGFGLFVAYKLFK